MRTITVFRNDEIIKVIEDTDISEQEAIEQAQDDFSYENFGQAGALTERDISKEEDFLNGKFRVIVANVDITN